jgi:hypothetical protein
MSARAPWACSCLMFLGSTLAAQTPAPSPSPSPAPSPSGVQAGESRHKPEGTDNRVNAYVIYNF